MQTSKLKTLIVYKTLLKYSDEENPLSTTELISLLKEKGINSERKSIYADIEALKEIGCDIVSTISPKRGFFVASRDFELPEVRLLIDAVNSAGFITPNKSKALVDKLEGLVSVYQAQAMESQVYCESAIKCENEEIYYIIDYLHRAIIKSKKVKFIYKKRNIDRENRKSYTEKAFTVSPYSLIWKEDHYYLICNNQKYDNLMNLRIDRIRKIEILDEASRPFSEVSEYKNSFDSADYASKMFNMFSGTTQDITLECNLDLREDIIDRFGSKIPLKAVDSNHFETTFSAALSDGLVSWIMQYGKDIKVISPRELREMIKNKANSIAELYN